MAKQYLGDAVYAEYSTYGNTLVLTTEDGISVTNCIIFEPETLSALLNFIGQARMRNDNSERETN